MWKLLAKTLLVPTLLLLGGCGGPSGSADSGDNTPPTPTTGDIVVFFTATPDTGEAPVTVTLDASQTYSNTGSPVVSYAWSATDSAGEEVQTASGKITSMAFIAAGTYTIKLTASDEAARYGVGQKSIVITAESPDTPTPATAVMEVSNGSAPLSLVLDASGSKASQGASIISYAWSITDAEGNIIESVNGVTATVTFAAEGSYTVALTVTDSQGNTSTARRNVSVSYATTLQASFSVTPVSGTVPFDIALDGSASETGGLQIRSYAWTLADAEGAAVQTANGKTTTMAIVAAGTYIVTLTVTDEFGRTATAHRTIEAVAPEAPAGP